MTFTIVRLGDFEFQGFEVPESIPFGGEQALTVHKMIGGKRVIDAMGADDAPLRWSGRFRGASALERAQTLDQMRRSGRKFALTWGGLAYTVVIQRFVPDYQMAYEIPYEIVCEVQSYDVDPVDPQQVIGVDDMVASDQLMADSLAVQIANPALSFQMINVDVALTSMGKAAEAGPTAIHDSLIPLAAARTIVQGLQVAADAGLGQVGDGALGVGQPPSALVANLLAQISGMAQSARLYEIEPYLGRTTRNLEAVGASGAEQRMIGGNLYELALGAYGDATEWSTIAQANGLTDPFLSGYQKILVPPSPRGLGGVPNV